MEHNTEHNTQPDTTPPEPPTDERPSLRRRVGLVAAGLALAVPIVGLTTYGIAGADSTDDSTEDSPEEVVEDCGEVWTPEDIAATNEEEDALAAFLDERGIAHTNEPDEDGIRWVFWEDTDEAANDAVDDFYAERYPLSPEDRAAATAEEDDLAAFLDARGTRYTRDTRANGVSYVEWDLNDDAANEAVSQFYAERYPAPEVADELGAQEESVSCVGMVEVGPG